MNIAIIIPGLEHKGPVIVARELCEKFCQSGHYCEVFYFNDNGPEVFPCKTSKISLFDIIDFDKFDIIHIHCLRPAIYIWLNKAKIKNAKIVITLHQPITYQAYRVSFNVFKAYIFSTLSQLIYKSFNNIVVLSKIQESLARPFIRQGSIEIIHNGRDVNIRKLNNKDHIDAIALLANQYNIVGTASVISKRKGLEQMVQALVKLPDCAFVCIGNGPELESLQNLAKHIGVADRCLWLGYQGNAVDYLPLFDVYVMCTRSEGFPLAFIEAAGAKCSCVLSDIEILKCIAPDNCVHFYQLDNIESLASNIHLAIKNREIYGARLYEYYSRYLTATAMANNYLHLFNKITKQ